MIEQFNAIRIRAGDIIPSNTIDEAMPVVRVVLASDYEDALVQWAKDIEKAEAENASLRAEVERLKMERRSYLAVEWHCRAIASLVVAPTDEDLKALAVIWDAIQGCNDDPTEDVHALLDAIARRATETGEKRND